MTGLDAFNLDGPRHPAAAGKAARLVVLLHGLGADGNDLIGLAPELSRFLPDAAFVSPDAPFPCDMAPFGRQWFSLRDRAPEAMLSGVRLAAPILDSFIDRELGTLGLDDGALALVGFSQGTMMALHVGLRRARPCAQIVGFSGMLVGGEDLGAEIASRPPVLLVHGQADEVVPFQAMPAAEAALKANDVPVAGLARPGLGHAIDPEGLTRAAQALTAAFA